MYLTIEDTANYLDLSINDVLRLISEKQIRYLTIEDTIYIYSEQFNLFLKQREKYLKELSDYLQTPLPEDADIKDED